MDLLKPKEITLIDSDGKERTFIISKMDACEGLEIIARWPVILATSSLPKVGWSEMWEIILKIMNYVAVPIASGNPMILNTKAMISNHTGDWKCLKELLEAEVAYNNGFFPIEMLSGFFGAAFRNALAKISETLTQSSAPSSPTEKPPSTNSAPSTP